MFHHLDRDDKPRMLREIRRVLEDGGCLQLMDFAGTERSGARLIDNSDRTIVAMLREAGFVDVVKTCERTVVGGLLRLACYRGSTTR
jgi:predicted methyltransferase